MISIKEEIIDLSNQLSVDSVKNVTHYFPIDRFFIEENGYLDKILAVNHLEFIFYNFENVNPTYSVQLFVCLPELWEQITYENIKVLLENFSNSFSFYSFIEYTYKYLEIDLFDEIMHNKNIDNKIKKDCIHFFISTLGSLYMDEDDYLDFEENVFGISMNKLIVLREIFEAHEEFKKILPQEKFYQKLISFQSSQSL